MIGGMRASFVAAGLAEKHSHHPMIPNVTRQGVGVAGRFDAPMALAVRYSGICICRFAHDSPRARDMAGFNSAPNAIRSLSAMRCFLIVMVGRASDISRQTLLHIDGVPSVEPVGVATSVAGLAVDPCLATGLKGDNVGHRCPLSPYFARRVAHACFLISPIGRLVLVNGTSNT